MKILLACSAGMSTSLLVNNMKKFADASDVIEARPVRTVPDILDDWDVLLLGPQVRYLEKEYKPLCEQKSARSLRNTSLAQRRMMGVQCCVRQWNTARQTALGSYLLVNCQDWVAMRLRCLPLSRNSLTVASTSTFKRNSLYYWTMKGIRPSLLL